MKINKLITALFAVTLTLSWATTMAAATRYVNPDGVCGGNVPCYTTIQAAINAAAPGDTINVADGFYDESVNINKTLTLRGAQVGVDARTRSGTESVINNACSPVQITADNVTLDGFTVQGSTVADPCTIAGIYMNPGGFGFQGGAQILNNIVQNNISGIEFDNTGTIPAKVQFNLIRNNNNTGPGSGNGIQTNFGLFNATIDNNKFIGQTNSSILFATYPAPNTGTVTVSNNTLDAGIGMFWAAGITITGNSSIGNTVSGTIYIGGDSSNIMISSNVLNNGIEAVVVEDQYGIGANTAVTVSAYNCIAGNSTNGLRVASGAYTGTLGATNNWWGAASGPNYNGTGPGTGDKITDPSHVVTFSPFLTSRTGTPCAPPPIGPPTNKDQCKNDGWKTFNSPRMFKNQGDCIQFVNTGK